MEAQKDTGEKMKLEGFGLNFLTPEKIELIFGFDNFLYATVKPDNGGDPKVYRGIFAVLCFPVTSPHQFVSLRYFDEKGLEKEVGIIKDPSDFPPEARKLLAGSLAKYYFEFEVIRVLAVTHRYGLLMFDVVTDHGPRQFEMRWRGDRAQDYGEKGKVLFDVFDCRYIIRNLDKLPLEDRELFTRYIYW